LRIEIQADDRKISIKDPDTANKRYGEVSFQFDKVFWTDVNQEKIFDSACRPLIDHILNGYNGCCFACVFIKK
jgi:kinesin family protein 7